MHILAAVGWKVVPRLHIGSFAISPHGLGIAVGYALGGALLARRAERLYGIAREHIYNMLTYAVLGVIVGARIFYVAGHWADVTAQDGVLGIFEIWNGGVVLYGGIFGGIAAAYPYARKHAISYINVLDAAAPGFPLGLIFGRIGDLIIGDHLGGPTSFFLGFRYRGGELPGCGGIQGVFTKDVSCPAIGQVVHQTALYDFISVVPLFLVVLALGRRRRRDGWLIMFAAVWYAAGRLAIDFSRTTTKTYLGLRGTQWVSVTLIVLGIGWLVRGARAAPVPAPAAAPLAWTTEAEGAEQMVSEGGPPGDDPAPAPPP